ncbi:small membrane protein [Klebsiella pneumoniae]|nr:small membrane protein [Klebsiella pneumoniae]HDS4072118.1 small membrane protein [Klebsiella pneumoniae subsp. pneumoniae]MDE4606300.1 small membrane protein [Klebsiella pneumoniae]HBR4939691.1 small membrane protein [Klebsiella pneumoniae]HBV1995725.1 small membrane protein [Klebsiella pneumoniae]HBW3113987.1 small membrane protein [Klebsiella pneumoniae]
MLASALVLFFVSMGFLISYTKERRRYKNTFKKRR